uniref:Uncharacterized protein n=1 Tax=Tanacetum cinerariifolium TaxID=118510 RepID=A0A699I913_TANCI|nr:hypothetical protein [Tanacetum cinerariifolium]
MMVMIGPLHTIYPPVAGVASLTEAKEPENPIWVKGKRAGCIPARRPGDAFVLPFLAKGPGEAKGDDLDKDRDINAGIQQHLQKLYNTNKASLKAAHWVINPETETYDVESIRQRRPKNITPTD